MTIDITLTTASAGSGKTYTLTGALSERIKHGAAHPDGLRPHQIIATTFTKKAAAELMDRTQKRLIDDGQSEAAAEVEAALIGTVNSIAGTIVDMYAIDAGLSPASRVLGADEQQRAFAVALDTVIAQAERENRALLRRVGYDAVDGDSSWGNTGESWVGTVRSVVEKARSNRIDAAGLRESCERSVSDMEAMLDSVQPETVPGLREQWRTDFTDCLNVLRDDVADIRAQGGPGKGMKWKSDGASRVSQSFSNVVGSIEVLEYYESLMKRRGVEYITWPTWMRIAKIQSLTILGRTTTKIGTRPVKAFAPLSEAILGIGSAEKPAPGVLGSQEFRADVTALIRLVFDTAIKALTRYETYKQQLGVMDFVDQETLAVSLVSDNERVRASLRSRYRFLAVDEFQDTSPIQLELFLRLSELVDDVLWVGDPKQSVYGFRGAAPELMEAVVKEATVTTLHHSYRSSERPVALVNALFTSIFTTMDPESIALDIPESRQAERHLGGVRIWDRPTSSDLLGGAKPKNEFTRGAIATGIAQLLAEGLEFPAEHGRSRPLEPRDIAVLSRTSSDLPGIVEELRSLGIPAVGPTRTLSATREGQILLAALAFLRDARDTLALTELIHLLDDHAAHESWFATLGALKTREERRAQLRQWREDPALAGLAHVRDLGGTLSPEELMIATIDALNLPERVKTWSRVEDRLDTLDAFRTLAHEYQKDSHSRGRGMSVAALYDFVAERAESFEHTLAPNAVLATTVHKAKGLQWPVVVSLVPEKHRADARDAVTVTSTRGIDARHPLEGRQISFVPKIGSSFAPLICALASHEPLIEARLRAQAEEARIHYVSLTRAKYLTILAPMSKPLDQSVLCSFDPALVHEQVAEELAWGHGVEDGGVPETSESMAPSTPLITLIGEDNDGASGQGEPDSGTVAIAVSGTRIPAGYPGSTMMDGASFVLHGVPRKTHMPASVLLQAQRSARGEDTAPVAVPAPGEAFAADGTPLPLLPLWNDVPGESPSSAHPADPEAENDRHLLATVEAEAAGLLPEAEGGEEGRGLHGTAPLAAADAASPAGSGLWVAERSPLAASDPKVRESGSGLTMERTLSARVKASASDLPEGARVSVRIVENLGSPLVSTGERGWELVGEAVHAYLALPLALMSRPQCVQAASRIAERWLAGLPALRTRQDWPAILVEAGSRWNAFLERTYPGASQATEVPVTMWNNQSQVMEGWVDSLLEVPASGSDHGTNLVLVDHKTFPDADPVAIREHVREENAGQIAVYLDAIEQARGVRPRTALIHLPLSGFVVEVTIEKG